MTGGVMTGGVMTGGVMTGGVMTGGVMTGGVMTGGVLTGGVLTGGAVGVDHADVLLGFADAAIAGDPATIAASRAAVVSALGHAAMIDAAGVIAGFNGITRIADATGIPLEDAKAAQTAAWRGALGIDDFQKMKS